jgi:3-oxoacyl-[acyl-carrier protein] reductase
LVCAGDYSALATGALIHRTISAEWGRLDALVNCAGVYIGADPIETPFDQWRRPLDIMIDGAVLLTRATVPLIAQGGRVIHITSIHGERADATSSAYAMAKAALNQYCRALALELASRSILVNAIAPGFVRTAMSIVDGANELDTDWLRANYVDGHDLPLGRAAQAEEMAGVAYFLAGPDASYITGQVLAMDGGSDDHVLRGPDAVIRRSRRPRT